MMSDKDRSKALRGVFFAALFSIVLIVLWNLFVPSSGGGGKGESQLGKRDIGTQQNQGKNLALQEKRGVQLPAGESRGAKRSRSRSGASSGVVTLGNGFLQVDIDLVGARVYNARLLKYDDILNSGVPQNLLKYSPDMGERNFAEYGWVGGDLNSRAPSKDSVWLYSRKYSTDRKVVLEWKNDQSLLFFLIFEVDDQYMIRVKQVVKGAPGVEANFAPYVRLVETSGPKGKGTWVSHEGFVGYVGNRFEEYKYSKIESYPYSQLVAVTSVNSWMGITGKYWLAAIIPSDFNCFSGPCLDGLVLKNARLPGQFQSRFSTRSDGTNRYNQIDYTYEFKVVRDGGVQAFATQLFFGPKELSILDHYSKKHSIHSFDKALDFGVLYFLTKPVFLLLHWINEFIGNFGFSIIVLTLVLKVLMLPLSVKSQVSMSKMKVLTPRIQEIRDSCGKNRSEYSRRLMELYSTEKINPLAGCVPIILQIPIFFALYKVLYVTIEMRHAYFFLWIRDLSSADPSSITNLFGLLPYAPLPFLKVGVLPILMGISMYIQQKVTPHHNVNESQLVFMKILPVMMTILLAGFPAGLLVYWTVSNVLSVIQQVSIDWYLNRTVRDGGW